MSRADPKLCVWINALSDAAIEMSARPRCEHKEFRRGSGERGNSGWVYVVFAPGTGLAKIGCCGTHILDKRLRTLQGMCPIPLELIAMARGGTQLEAHWHGEFKKHRRHAEWFDADVIVPLFRDAMKDAPPDGCARCVIMKDRTNQPSVSQPSARARRRAARAAAGRA